MQHGFSRNAGFWRRWIPQIAATRRVYRTEVRGCGRSSVPPPGFSIEPAVLVRDIVRVLDALEVERVHWVGESSGGVLGILFASTYPGRVSSLTLLNTPIRVSIPTERTAAASTTFDIYALDTASPAAAIEKYGVEEWSRRTLSEALDVELASKEIQDFYVTEKGKTPTHVAVAYLSSVQTVDTLPMLKRLEIPVLLMGGDKKKSTVEQQQIMVREIPHVELKVFPGFGKAIHVLAPEDCAREAVAFWERIDPTAT